MRTPVIALLPGALSVYLGFSSGGYFPPATGIACAILALALVLRLTLAEEPLKGLGALAAAGLGALGLLAAWTIASSGWSDAPGRAVAEFDRVLLYLLVFGLVATLPRTPEAARLLLAGLTAGGALVCLAGLVTRVLPDLFSVELSVLPQRLSYPISYWNGLGLLAVLALVGAVHFTCSEREPVAARVAAAGLVPLLATTLYFTFSRASIAIGVVAVLAYMLLARPRGLAAGILAAGPATVLAVALAYGAELLARPDPTAAAAVGQGETLAPLLLACALGAAALRFLMIRAGLDGRLERLDPAPRTRRMAWLATGLAVVFAAAGSWVAFDLGDRIERQYERFKEGDTLAQTEDARDRLTDVANNGRIDHWDVAVEAWSDNALKGTGAGTYELTWAMRRPVEFTVRDGHSLYLEAMSELGLVGALFLLAALALGAAALVVRTRGPERALWGALLVASGAWALHAAQDWVWELPALTIWPFAAGAAALARPGGGPHLPRIGRVVAALAVLALAVTPLLAGVSHSRARDSIAAFKRGDCGRAIDKALSATSALAAPAPPYAILSFCDARAGEFALAERLMHDAIDRDPENWEYHFGLALVLGAGSEDPRAAIARARELNPLSGVLIRTQRAFDTDDPEEWRRRAISTRLPIN